MGLSSSLVLGVPIGTFLSSMIGWKALFAAIGLITLIPLIVVYRRIPSMKEQELVTLGMQLSILKDKRILLAVAVTLFYVGGYSTLFTYLTPFLQESANLSITEISGILLLAGICSFLGSSLGGIAADKNTNIHDFLRNYSTNHHADAACICDRESRGHGGGYHDMDDCYMEHIASSAAVSRHTCTQISRYRIKCQYIVYSIRICFRLGVRRSCIEQDIYTAPELDQRWNGSSCFTHDHLDGGI